MRIDFSRYITAFENLPQGVIWAEVNADLRDEVTLHVKNGEQTGCECLERMAIYLRASDGTKIGTVYTEQLDDDPEKMMKTAVQNAKFMDAVSTDQPNQSGNIQLGVVEDEADTPEMLNFARAVEAAVKELSATADIKHLTIRRTVMVRRITNSFGLDNYQEHQFYLAELSTERGSSEESPLVKRSATKLADIDVKELAAQAVHKGGRAEPDAELKPVALSSGKYDCVFSSEVTRQIFVTAWQEFVGGYMAGNKAIFNPEPGTHIGSPCFSVVDTPRLDGWGYCLALDSEGTECKTKDLVRGGKLATPMYSLTTAAAAGVKSTGNAGRVALLTGTTPVNIVTIPSILYIEPGEATEAELVQKMGSGILLTYSLDEFHSITISSGEFSIPCGGIVYENGKPVGTVEQITMAGNLRELFDNIQAVGCDLEVDEFEYKNYCFGGPSLLVTSISISSAG